MADFLELIDNTLGTHFNSPKYDPAVGRNKLKLVIATAAKQHADSATGGAGRRTWKLGNNDAISFAPKLGGRPVLINGNETNYVPADRFQAFLSGLAAAVEAGDLDDEIKTALEAPKGGTDVSGGKAGGIGSFGGGKSKDPLTNVRRAVGSRITRGGALDEIEAALKATGKYAVEHIEAVIGERKAAK